MNKYGPVAFYPGGLVEVDELRSPEEEKDVIDLNDLPIAIQYIASEIEAEYGKISDYLGKYAMGIVLIGGAIKPDEIEQGIALHRERIYILKNTLCRIINEKEHLLTNAQKQIIHQWTSRYFPPIE